MVVKFKKLEKGARLPEKATAGSAAYDLYIPKNFVVRPGRQIVPLCFAMEMENGYEALIDARSGFSAKGMEGYAAYRKFEGTPINEIDTSDTNPSRFDCDVIQGKIDADYRLGVGVIIHNRDSRTFILKAGTRIAQMTFHKVEDVEWVETDTLSETDRDGGFGSTGVK
jgi:dUTP pyrophosphatase